MRVDGQAEGIATVSKGRRIGRQGPAWRRAEAYGCDMTLIADNLRRPPSERIKAHQQALKTAIMLQRAMRMREGRHV